MYYVWLWYVFVIVRVYKTLIKCEPCGYDLPFRLRSLLVLIWCGTVSHCKFLAMGTSKSSAFRSRYNNECKCFSLPPWMSTEYRGNTWSSHWLFFRNTIWITRAAAMFNPLYWASPQSPWIRHEAEVKGFSLLLLCGLGLCNGSVSWATTLAICDGEKNSKLAGLLSTFSIVTSEM